MSEWCQSVLPDAVAAGTVTVRADLSSCWSCGTADVLGSSPVVGSTPTSAADPSKKLGRVSQFLGKLQLRRRVAGGIRQLAEQTAQSISKYASEKVRVY